MVEIRQISSDESRELRRSVLRPHFAVNAPLPGDFIADAVHLGAFAGDELISTCFVAPEDADWVELRPSWRLRSMATAETARGTGAGRTVLAAAVDVVAAAGAPAIWCHAREVAIGFYARQGWLSVGELFPTEIGPHLHMWRRVP